MITSTEIQVQYLVMWETSRGKCQWISQKILENEHLCSSQAKAFLYSYLQRAVNEEKLLKKSRGEDAATKIQKEMRRYICRKHFQLLTKAIIVLQLRFRSAKGQLHLRRQRLLKKRRLNYMKKLMEEKTNMSNKVNSIGDIFGILHDARMSVITSGNHTGSDENVWICEHCDFRNEQKAERCELCLEAPSISRKVLQLGKQHIASLKKNNSSSRGTNILSPSQNRSKLKKQLLKGKHTSKQKKKQKRHTLI